MSGDIPSWKSLASAASRSVKNYVVQKKSNLPLNRDLRTDNGEGPSTRLTLTQWAGKKLRRNGQNDDGTNDRLSLFPGWATRRYHQPLEETSAPPDAPFDVEVFVSGFASRYNGPGFNTRASRAFLKLARGFAALPKLPGQQDTPGSYATPDSAQSYPDYLRASSQLPALPDEMDEESEIAALERQFRDMEADDISTTSLPSDGLDPGASPVYPNRPPPNGVAPTESSDLQRWHANLEARLHPFWSSALSSRTVRMSLYISDPLGSDSSNTTDESGYTDGSSREDRSSIVSQNVFTSADGAFQAQFVIPWETLCVHPGALQIIFSEPGTELDLFILAELMPPPSPANSGSSSPAYGPTPTYFPMPTTTCSIPVTLSYSKVRLISDIDDTVKLSHILSGARAVFHNVFVKELKENVIDGMGDWYTAMWERGVRFHYVSNSPFELLPVINEFFQLSHLPPGSIKLRSYAGRTLFNGLLSAPAARKRAGVTHVLDSFPQSRFFLVGDSAEQDLELYASMAKERPEQILAIFIRDASTQPLGGAVGGGIKPLDDPTGERVLKQGSIPRPTPPPVPSRAPRSDPPRSKSDGTSPTPYARYVPRRPVRMHSDNLDAPSTPSSGTSSYPPSVAPMDDLPVMEEPTEQWSPNGITGERPLPRSPAPSKAQQQLFELEKRRSELQVRVYRARLEIPRHVKLRVFRTPQECVEAMDIIRTL